jgi:hypothetical protein
MKIKFFLRKSFLPRSNFSLSVNDQGFALLEVIVAMAIMAIVGLLAWRGMDAMIRGRELIERRSNQDLAYIQLVRQFDRDCQEIIRRDELNLAVGGLSANSGSLPSVAAGIKNIWWLRHYHADARDAWLLVGYGIGPTGLQRWTSPALLRGSDALNLWSGIVRNPDLISSDLLVSWQVPNIVRQVFTLQSSVVNGVDGGGISASRTSNPPSNASSSANTSNTNSGTISVVTPDQQGLVMQWWLQDTTLPITRSCLMGGAL